MKIRQHLTWCLLFYDKNMFVRKKNILPWSNLEVPPFRKFVTEVLFFRSSRSRMFFKIGVLKNFAIFTGKRLCWPLQAFFYRTPTVTASRFSRQQILFWAEFGIYCWQSHRCLLRTSLKIRVKRPEQPLKLLCKKGVFRNFAGSTGKQLYWSLFLIELLTFRPADLLKRDSNTDAFLWNLQSF